MKTNKLSNICFLILILPGCSGDERTASKNGSFSESEENLVQAPSSMTLPAQGNVYRLLTAVRTNVGNKSILAVACEQELGFKRKMTGSKVTQAREINIPVSATVYDPVVYVTRYRVVRVQPPSVNGIVFNTKEKQVPYTVQEVLPGPHYVQGSCLGSEYIIE